MEARGSVDGSAALGGRLNARSRDAERIRDIGRALEVWQEGRSAIEETAPELMDLLGLEQFATYSISPGPKHWAVDYCLALGFQMDVRPIWSEYVASFPEKWGPYDPARPEQPQRNRVVRLAELGTREALETMPVYEAWKRCNLHEKDQIRVLLCDGDVLLRWIGGHRREPFTEREEHLLTELVPNLLERVKLERRLGQEALTLSALAAALEAIPAAALIVRQGASVVHANRAGSQLLDRNHGRLPDELRGTNPEPPDFDITQLESPGLGPHYLAIHRGMPDRSARIREFARQWDLTRRQVQVLDLIVQGESNKRMAGELGCSLRTVELHVSNVLRKARAESRGALTAKFWGQLS